MNRSLNPPPSDPLNPHNLTVELGFEFENDDCAWVMACVFIIFTMQTGMLVSA